MPDDGTTPTPSAKDIAQRGEAIYGEKYQREFEVIYNGKFVAINIATTEATVADTAEEAVRIALEKDPSGFFHLMRVGQPAAFEAGWYMTCAV